MPKKGQRGARRPLGAEGDSQGFAALAAAYLEALRVRNYSEATIASREHHLREFIRWAEERGLARPSEVTKPTLERYQRWLYHYRKKNGEPAWVPPPGEEINIPFVIDEETLECPMAHMPELEASIRKANFEEVELGYARDLAKKESTRCLRCDVEL